jgi:hypothetical protein
MCRAFGVVDHERSRCGRRDSPEGACDAEAEQDHARSLLRRIRILATRARERQVEKMAAEVFQQAYGALAASASMADAYRAWESVNDYICNLVR